MAKELTQNDFDSAVSGSPKCIVDFWAAWCGPCRAQAPYLEQLPAAVDVFKVNVDEQPDLAHKYGIVSIPTLLVFENGKQTKRVSGLQNLDQLTKLLS